MNSPRYIALIPAAGMGSRMQAGINKQYLQLGDRPLLAHTLAVFERHPAIDRVVVVVPAAEIDYCQRTVVAACGYTKVTAVVAGGAERQDSVRLGLDACGAHDDDLVLIHDGARPFLNAAQIDAVLAAAMDTGAALLGVPVKDTIKQVAAGRVVCTPERGSLWQAQTPQAFRLGLIRTAHHQALRDDFRGTDDATLVERLGQPVAMVTGSYRNLKITTPEDLVLAQALLVTPGGES